MPAASQNTPQRHTRANQDQLKLSGIDLERHERGNHVV